MLSCLLLFGGDGEVLARWHPCGGADAGDFVYFSPSVEPGKQGGVIAELITNCMTGDRCRA
jgi:hypothetical protein